MKKYLNSFIAIVFLIGSGSVALAADKPEVISANVKVVKNADGSSDVSLTIKARSISPVNWLDNSLYSPKKNIFGGGGTARFEDMGGNLWEYNTQTNISKYMPTGTYVFKHLSVENAARESSEDFRDISFEINNPDYMEGDIPEIISIIPEVEENDASDNIIISLTIRAKSVSPVEYLNSSLYSPRSNVYGGGGSANFRNVGEDLWEYVTESRISKFSLGGNYTFKHISVENAAQEESATARDVVVSIETEMTPKILSITPHKEVMDNGDVRISLTIKAFSRTPIHYLSLSLDDPNGNSVSGGGHSVSFDDLGDNLWEHTTYGKTIDKHAPRGIYTFRNIRVENTIQEESRDFDPIEVVIE